MASREALSSLRYVEKSPTAKHRRWSEISVEARRATNHKCCWCITGTATATHHAMYVDEQGAIAGRENPGMHVFPVCDDCHRPILHTSNYWIYGDSHFLNRNTDAAIARLKTGWKVLTEIRT